MRTTTLAARDGVETDLLIAVRRYRYKKRNKGYKLKRKDTNAIISVYDLYDRCRGAHDDGLNPTQLNSKIPYELHRAYAKTYENRPLEHIRSAIMDNEAECAYCDVSEASEMDHFLPREHYKFLSIYPRNFVPSCDKCNKIKSTNILLPSGRPFIHPGFETIPDDRFMKANVVMENGAIMLTFEVDFSTNINTELGERIVEQHEVLKVGGRHTKPLNSFLKSLCSRLSRSGDLDPDPEFVANFLLEESGHQEFAHHTNHWKSIAPLFLSQSQEFCEEGFKMFAPTIRHVVT